jgi:hypothetical protein
MPIGHIKPTVQKGLAQTRCIYEKDSLLAVGELAQGAAVLPLRADRVLAFLWETAPVKDKSRYRSITSRRADVRQQVMLWNEPKVYHIYS